MKQYTDNELIQLGRKIQEARRLGGLAIYNKYGKEHFQKMGIKSAKTKRNKNKTRITNYITNDVKINKAKIQTSNLTKSRYSIITKLQNTNMTLSEIGEHLGISRQRVHQIIKKFT